ncbi:MAG: hypothetical protein IKW30_09770 [Lachnospiraceae bacterium]|nr:hypothetical protein [Lachnospiraceae bacterium]
MSIVDVMVLGSGIYILYHTFIMKRNNEIPKGIMIAKDMVLPKDADVAGFILDMYLKGIIVGLSACISGVFGLLSVKITQLQSIAAIVSFAFFGVLVAFIVFLKKAQKKYLHIG